MCMYVPEPTTCIRMNIRAAQQNDNALVDCMRSTHVASAAQVVQLLCLPQECLRRLSMAHALCKLARLHLLIRHFALSDGCHLGCCVMTMRRHNCNATMLEHACVACQLQGRQLVGCCACAGVPCHAVDLRLCAFRLLLVCAWACLVLCCPKLGKQPSILRLQVWASLLPHTHRRASQHIRGSQQKLRQGIGRDKMIVAE